MRATWQRRDNAPGFRSIRLDNDYYRNLLLARRAELEAVREQGDAAAATVELDQTRVGRLSRMDALQDQAMARATASRRERELTRIGAALARLDDGEFGDCIKCGEPIPPARLAIDPAILVCVACAERLEQP